VPEFHDKQRNIDPSRIFIGTPQSNSGIWQMRYLCLKNRWELIDFDYDEKKSEIFIIDWKIEELFIQSVTENFEGKT